MTKTDLHKRTEKVSKKRKKFSAELSTTCNVTGLGCLGGDNELNCLEAMIMSTTTALPPQFCSTDDEETRQLSCSSPPPPPGIHQIPNIRVELARHRQTQTLSTFLLKSCPGLRMPTFERWLLDSKLEESDRFHSIILEWIENPSLKLAFTTDSDKMTTKKKYGRAARYDKPKGVNYKDTTSLSSYSASCQERERARFDKDCKLVWEAEKRTISSSTRQQQLQQQQFHDVVANTILCNIDRDIMLPHNAFEMDPSCDRLIKEIIASISSTHDTTDSTPDEEKAKEIVRELCHRSAEACKEIRQLEQHLGKYQKFSWDCGCDDSKRKRRDSVSSSNGSIDKVLVEWHNDNRLCSLVYVPKKQKSSSRGAPRTATTNIVSMSANGNVQHDEGTSSTKSKPKPFVVKINSAHYHKLRNMFDSTYRPDQSFLPSTGNDRIMTTAFHAVLFSLIIRYSALSGGQLLNDRRGGGMQGAVHDAVFDCLSKWFRDDDSEAAATGAECFASPFNQALSRYFSAFPSPDLDGHFGSYGDFFYPTSSSSSNHSIFFRPGWFELNPPFSPGIMTKMAYRLTELLDMQTNLDLDVTYVVIIPTVRCNIRAKNVDSANAATKKKTKKEKHPGGGDGDNTATNLMTTVVNQAAAQPFIQLTNSRYCNCHIVLPPREHGYIEGSQHLRPTQFKESHYSTSVIVLRTICSSSGRRSMGDDAEDTKKIFEMELREAFASRHAMEVAQRKEKQCQGPS